MNWTGGQLQRHHTRSGLLTKTQKRNFAKSRLKNTAIAASPFRNFPEGSSTRKDGPVQSTESKIQAVEPVSHLPTHLTDRTSAASELSDIKRNLLKESDWAVVSATRPLQLVFTSGEELERFGKRRRLNENDRKRLADDGPTSFPFSRNRARNSSSVIDTIEDIQIEINGRPVVHPRDSSGAINNLSSQSMLLDHEGFATPQQAAEKEHLTATWINNLCSRPN